MTSLNRIGISALTVRVGILLFVLKTVLTVIRRPTAPISPIGILVFSVPALVAVLITLGKGSPRSPFAAIVIYALVWMHFAAFTLEMYLVDVSQVIHHGGVIVLWPWLAVNFALAVFLLAILGIRFVLVLLRGPLTNRH